MAGGPGRNPGREQGGQVWVGGRPLGEAAGTEPCPTEKRGCTHQVPLLASGPKNVDRQPNEDHRYTEQQQTRHEQVESGQDADHAPASDGVSTNVWGPTDSS